ncbi:MAG: type II toxin-antitoxin system RelE/ParE family toxin [Campylobacterota bacterium]|nr:type II toxin-antitoxin system RelE/ParE family toxin [Campylobacterota bacterium]
MAFKLIWSEEALEDITSIAEYIEKDSPIYAKAVVSKFFEKVELLKKFSELGRAVPEINENSMRELFIYSYRLIYKIEQETILIIAVIHGKRLLENYDQK